MKNQIVRILTALGGIVLWLAGVGQAQIAPHHLKVSVPFEFSINDKVFPAGSYDLVCTPGQIELRDARSQVLATAISHSVQAPNDSFSPELVFATDSGVHELRQIWIGDPHNGYELPRSKAAIAMARQRSYTTITSGTK